jgi:hypothetical protein
VLHQAAETRAIFRCGQTLAAVRLERQEAHEFSSTLILINAVALDGDRGKMSNLSERCRFGIGRFSDITGPRP